MAFRRSLRRSFRSSLIPCLARRTPLLRTAVAAPASSAPAAFLLVARLPSARTLWLLVFAARHWLRFFRLGCGGLRSRFIHGGR